MLFLPFFTISGIFLFYNIIVVGKHLSPHGSTMNILIANNELYLVCKLKTNIKLNNSIASYISKFSFDIGLDTSTIRNIIIANLNDTAARVEEPQTVQRVFDIFINEYLIWYLHDEKLSKEVYSEAVIKHELFHCIDTLNMLHINRNIIDKPLDNYDDLCLSIGYYQWSEYFAHYNSSKIFPSDIIKLQTDYQPLYKSIRTFKEACICSIDSPHFELYNKHINLFIQKIIILLANMNSIESQIHIVELEKYKSIDNSVREYIDNVNSILNHIYMTYPKLLSYETFRMLGKTLLDF